jgi:hypothetical protein
MSRQLELRKRQYAAKYENIMQNLTINNIDTYLVDILNILCIPYGIGCYENNINNTIVILNGILHRNLYFEFKKVSITMGMFWGYYTTYYNIDSSNLRILYKMAKLICTSNKINGHIQPPSASAFRLNISLLTDNFSCDTSFPKMSCHITLGFIYDDTIELRIEAIKDAMRNSFHGTGFTFAPPVSAIPYEPVAIKVENPNNDASTPTAPLADAEVVA